MLHVTLPTESVFGVRMLRVLTESGTKRASVWRVVTCLTSMLPTPGEWPNHHRPLGVSSKFAIILF